MASSEAARGGAPHPGPLPQGEGVGGHGLLGPGQAGMLSVLIVNWNTRDLLRACLQALAAHPYRGEGETIVVDNGSADGSAAMVEHEFPQARLIANTTNRGYAAATNQALAASRGEWLLLLNSDTEVQDQALDHLVACLGRHPAAAAAAAHLLNPDGTVQRSVRGYPEPWPMAAEALGLAALFPRWRAVAGYRLRYWSHDTEREIEQPMSSALLLRRAALEQVGLLDEGFPPGGFYNDVDLCRRLDRAGWRVVYCPDAPVVHHLGASTGRLGWGKFCQSQAGLMRYYRKHYPGWRHFPKRALMAGLSWLSLAPRAARQLVRAGKAS